MNCIEAAGALIERQPLARALFYREFRRQTLRRFPYTLCYLVRGEAVILSLVFHASRDPRELYSRL